MWEGSMENGPLARVYLILAEIYLILAEVYLILAEVNLIGATFRNLALFRSHNNNITEPLIFVTSGQDNI
jgi:hypothetical protein